MGHASGGWAHVRASVCVLVIITATVTASWDPDQLEVFDVVEEVNQNFYQLMNISQDADNTQIKKAFRGLSLVLHPDKNDSPDADVQFRNLVSVYDVLRDANKRKHYDDVLVNGLPNWRSAVYYYRHYRKMGLAEMTIILFCLITIAQYLIGWASYFEKKYTHEQVYQAKLEKKKKKLTKKGQIIEDLYEKFDLPRPSMADTLPIQLPRFVWRTIVGVPSAVRMIREIRRDAERQREEQLELERIQRELEIEQEQKRLRDKALRKRRAGFKLEERDEDDLPPLPGNGNAEGADTTAQRPPPVTSGGLWTDDDLAELVQLVKRYPGGTTDRWERIAEQMGRSVQGVTFMAAKLKENCYRLPDAEDSVPTAMAEPEVPKKQKTRGGKAGVAAGDTPVAIDEWTQTQQKALEAALAKHPKGPADRWEKIAKCVPNKTKEECMLRYKQLVEIVKKKKETNEQEQ